jgi:cell wall-associated NlpC family hydrolase
VDHGGESGSERAAGRLPATSGRLMVRLVLAMVVLAAVTTTAMVRQFGQHTIRTTPASSKALGRYGQQPRPLGSQKRATPAPPATAAGPGGKGAATTTTAGPVATAAVAPMAQLHDPSALVTLPGPVSFDLFKALAALNGVTAVELVDTGTVQLAGAPAVTIGVDPSSFRNFTPRVTAGTDRLWQYIATGTFASSLEMAHVRKLTLGASVPVVAAGAGAAATVAAATSQWLGAFMSVGLPGVDLVVSHTMAAPLHLTPNAGLILSAPGADPFELQNELKRLAPDAAVVLMRPGQAVGLTGTTAGAQAGGGAPTAAQVSTMLTAATSRLGKPYVWGATGPNGFDCSGLVGWSFAAAGINLPRTAAEQALTGPAVPLKQIQPGDLLFWAWDPADPGFIDHVAIYLGNGQMIEAPFTGAVVHVVAVATSHLVGAVRVSPALSARMGGAWSH